MRREIAAVFLWFIAGLIAASGQSGTYIFSVGGLHYSQSDFSLHYMRTLWLAYTHVVHT